VKIWQSQHVDPVHGRPLYVDGIVGPVTWRAMFPF
jgi:peptidoglycan hydrolase-like protein with peptidoglycan-binding domain